MGTTQETTSRLTPAEVAMTPSQKLKKLWGATKTEALWVKVKQRKTAEGNMLWTHHQEEGRALAHCITIMYYYIVLLDSNNNSNTYIQTVEVRASTFAHTCVLSKKSMRRPSWRDENAMGQMNGETGRKVWGTRKPMWKQESWGLILGKEA